jgi:hypothetical protein
VRVQLKVEKLVGACRLVAFHLIKKEIKKEIKKFLTLVSKNDIKNISKRLLKNSE